MSVQPLVLAIDDEPGVLRLIKLELSSQGFRVVTADSGETGVRLEEEHRPDIVLLDVMMPEVDGFETMRRIRDRTNVPIVLLTAKGSDSDKVKGLEMGADDYLAKPFNPEELTARVRAVLRRAVGAPGPSHEVIAGDVKIDLHTRLVWKNGERVALTRTEWMLLQHLAANPGRSCSTRSCCRRSGAPSTAVISSTSASGSHASARSSSPTPRTRSSSRHSRASATCSNSPATSAPIQTPPSRTPTPNLNPWLQPSSPHPPARPESPSPPRRPGLSFSLAKAVLRPDHSRPRLCVR